MSIMGSSCYFVTFVYDFSRFTQIYLMEIRSELLGIFCVYVEMIALNSFFR